MSVMTENQGKAEKNSYQRLAEAYEEYLVKPELRQKLVDNLSATLDTEEKIERFAENSKIDPNELKDLLKGPQ